MTSVYVHGTDGAFLYVTLPEGGGMCTTGAARYKIDRCGTPTMVPVIPKGLKGGRDEISGGPPCEH